MLYFSFTCLNRNHLEGVCLITPRRVKQTKGYAINITEITFIPAKIDYNMSTFILEII